MEISYAYATRSGKAGIILNGLCPSSSLHPVGEGYGAGLDSYGHCSAAIVNAQGGNVAHMFMRVVQM